MSDDTETVDRLGLRDPGVASRQSDAAIVDEARRAQRRQDLAARTRWPLIEAVAQGLGNRAPNWPPPR